MAWVNMTYAKDRDGQFILRFDDLAPRIAGDDVSKMSQWALEAESLLREAGIIPDRVTSVSDYTPAEAVLGDTVGGRNRWIRAADFEGHDNLLCSPGLVRARVRADIAENIGAVIRGDELLVELQLYESLNAEMGGSPRDMIFLPRLRVREEGVVTTISKTVGNLQLRDLFRVQSPEAWLHQLRAVLLIDPDAPLSWENIHPYPIIDAYSTRVK